MLEVKKIVINSFLRGKHSITHLVKYLLRVVIFRIRISVLNENYQIRILDRRVFLATEVTRTVIGFARMIDNLCCERSINSLLCTISLVFYYPCNIYICRSIFSSRLRIGWSVKAELYEKHGCQLKPLSDSEQLAISSVIKRAEALDKQEQERIG